MYFSYKFLDQFQQIYDTIILKCGLSKKKHFKTECSYLFLHIRNNIQRYSPCRNVERLSPAVIFLYFKGKGIYINLNTILRKLALERFPFLNMVKIVMVHHPNYKKRSRTALIANIIKKVAKTYSFDDRFGLCCEHIFKKLGPKISDTKENVIGGTTERIAKINRKINILL